MAFFNDQADRPALPPVACGSTQVGESFLVMAFRGAAARLVAEGQRRIRMLAWILEYMAGGDKITP